MSSINNINSIPQKLGHNIVSFFGPQDFNNIKQVSKSMHALTDHFMKSVPQDLSQTALSFCSPQDLHSFTQTSGAMRSLADHSYVWQQIGNNLNVMRAANESFKDAIIRRSIINEVNENFINAMNFIKHPDVSSAFEDMMGEPAPDLYDPIPAGTNPYDSREKIIQWIATENARHIIGHQPLTRLEQARTGNPHIVPAAVRDPRVLQLILSAQFPNM